MPAFPTFYGVSSGSIINAKQYGAVGDGIADDTAAINAAIAAIPAIGGAVFFPAGTYKVTSAITLKNNLTLRGVVRGQNTFTNDSYGSVIDGRSITTAGNIVGTKTSGNTQNVNYCNITIESLSIRGRTESLLSDAGVNDGVSCLYIGYSAAIRISDVYVEGGNEGITLAFSNRLAVDNTHVAACRNRAMCFYGSSQGVVSGGLYQNSGHNNNAADGGIYIGGNRDAGVVSSAITLILPIQDECGHASVNITAADDITFFGGTFYFSKINANSVGPGYGFKFGDGTDSPTNVTIVGTKIGPFGASQPCTNTIWLRGSNHRLIGVTTDTGGGGDIQDDATGTIYSGVNGHSKLPAGTAANVALSLGAANTGLFDVYGDGRSVGISVGGFEKLRAEIGDILYVFAATTNLYGNLVFNAATGQILVNASASGPQYSVTGSTGNGIRVISDRIDIWMSGGVIGQFDATGLSLNGTVIGWSSNVFLGGGSDGTGRLVQKNGATAQAFSIASTYTSFTNKEEVELGWTSSVAHLWTIKGSGGGTARDLVLGRDSTEMVRLGASLLTIADAVNVALNTSTGTKIGTATTQKLGFWNATPVVRPAAYTPTNVTTDRSYDANATTLDEIADVLGTLIADMQSIGLIG